MADTDKTKGAFTLYMNALFAKVDQHLDDANNRRLVVEGVVEYTFSPIPGNYVIDGEALWPKLRAKHISRSAAYDFVPNKDKIAKLVEEGRVPVEAVEKHTTQREGYMRHTVKLLRPPE
jgi:hypothetical protein